MFIRNKFFLLCCSLIIVQQLLLAVSTFNIAKAGGQLNDPEKYSQLVTSITLFFIFAILAYVTSSIQEIIKRRVKNNAWKEYSIDIIEKASLDQNLNALNNKKALSNWITGESKEALGDITDFFLEGLSVYLNIFFTLYVFYLSLGVEITIAIFLSMLLAILLLNFMKNKIKNVSSEIQIRKLKINNYIPIFLENKFNFNKDFIEDSNQEINRLFKKYSESEIDYILIEQFLAVTPIVLSVCILTLFINIFPIENHIVAGAMVALLPRSLQLFGNIHSFNMINSRIVFTFNVSALKSPHFP